MCSSCICYSLKEARGFVMYKSAIQPLLNKSQVYIYFVCKIYAFLSPFFLFIIKAEEEVLS